MVLDEGPGVAVRRRDRRSERAGEHHLLAAQVREGAELKVVEQQILDGKGRPSLLVKEVPEPDR